MELGVNDFLGLAPLLAAIFLGIDLHLIRIDGVWRKVVAAVLFVVAIATRVIYTAFVGEGPLAFAPMLAVFAILVIAAIVLRRMQVAQLCFSFCMLAVTCRLCTIIPTLVYAEFPWLPVFVPLAISIVVSVLAAVLMHFLLKEEFTLLMESTGDEWSTAALFAIIGTAIIIVTTFLVGSSISMWIDLILTIYMALLLASQVSTMSSVRSSLQRAHDLETFKMQTLNQQEAAERRKADEAEERRRRHDQRHALQVVIDELKLGDVEQAISHLEDIRGDVPQATRNYCKHMSVNGAISMWVQKAEEQGIEVQVRADVPQDLDVDPVELSTIVGNLMENAYEGCMRVERTEARRYINVRCIYNNRRLSCEIENSCRTDIKFEDGLPQTQKRGGGIGTHSVKATVERLGGMCDYSTSDGVFKARFVLAI